MLRAYDQRPEVLVLGLPRGGVPVAAVVAKVLQVELDICLVRKLGVPGNPELAMGAVGWGGQITRNPHVLESSRITPEAFAAVVAQERQELQRRERCYRCDRPPLQVRDRTVILIDDGVATGATMLAAIASLESQGPSQLIVAVPLASTLTVETLAERVDEVICAATPHPFRYLGLWYQEFAPTSDEEVCQLLEASSSSSDFASGLEFDS